MCKAKTHGNKEGKVRYNEIEIRRRSKFLPSDCGQRVAHVGKVNIAVDYNSRHLNLQVSTDVKRGSQSTCLYSPCLYTVPPIPAPWLLIYS